MAKTLWCWRCRMELPMLEEDEWSVLMRAHHARSAAGGKRGIEAALSELDREAARRGLPPVTRPPPGTHPVNSWLWHLTAGYELFTGVPESNPNAVYHHRAADYGPPCPTCGKPLRTPKARFCAACGA